MRADVAVILIGMGYVPDVDFTAVQSVPDAVDLFWLSKQPQPSEKEIDAFALANPTAYQDRLDAARHVAAKAMLVDATLIKAVAVLLVEEIRAAVPSYQPPVIDDLIAKAVAVIDAGKVDTASAIAAEIDPLPVKQL